jgi:hypothetical protein
LVSKDGREVFEKRNIPFEDLGFRNAADDLFALLGYDYPSLGD